MSSTALVTSQSFRNLYRRRFSKQEKYQIVREFLHLDISLVRFAREQDLHYNQLSRWRKECLASKFGSVSALGSPDLQWLPVKAEAPAAQIPIATRSGTEKDEASLPVRVDDMFNLGRLQIKLKSCSM